MKQKTDYKWLLAIVAVLVLAIVFADPIKNFVQFQIKMQSLRTLYIQLASAFDQKRWSDYYDLSLQSAKRYVSRDQFANYMTNHSAYSSKSTINNTNITENTGTVSSTIVLCLSLDCSGGNKKVETLEKTYIYENGKWKTPPENEPSEKALNNAEIAFTNNSKEKINDGIQTWSRYGVSSLNYAIHNYALYLDQNPEELTKLANYNEQYKKKKTVIRQIPLPEYNPPRLQIKQPQQTNCYPNGVGGFNCTTY
ncbi:MAG: hypothetical protein NTY75_00240 [Candidatus Shapirobacteria bacterium]|nr:hypothetical protein [Candidatus Shapirobacteria bacterium]